VEINLLKFYICCVLNILLEIILIYLKQLKNVLRHEVATYV